MSFIKYELRIDPEGSICCSGSAYSRKARLPFLIRQEAQSGGETTGRGALPLVYSHNVISSERTHIMVKHVCSVHGFAEHALRVGVYMMRPLISAASQLN
ncbi:hypothetical protein XENOCAPTIV_029033 [Xenoophorus captivus]|uniref:Uncharacterized protein n=1 Tax=Xenoophorus captivus TaxID=1517983 RepID=A0ABV0Q6N8_9TELE